MLVRLLHITEDEVREYEKDSVQDPGRYGGSPPLVAQGYGNAAAYNFPLYGEEHAC